MYLLVTPAPGGVCLQGDQPGGDHLGGGEGGGHGGLRHPQEGGVPAAVVPLEPVTSVAPAPEAPAYEPAPAGAGQAAGRLHRDEPLPADGQHWLCHDGHDGRCKVGLAGLGWLGDS